MNQGLMHPVFINALIRADYSSERGIPRGICPDQYTLRPHRSPPDTLRRRTHKPGPAWRCRIPWPTLIPEHGRFSGTKTCCVFYGYTFVI